VPRKGPERDRKGSEIAAPTELSERILDYGTRVIKVVEALPNTLVGRRIADQLLRSGLSVGANFEEAQAENRRPISHSGYSSH
jgi:four helix bundle protein